MRGGLSSRRKKVVLGGSADASGVEDAQKLLQKCKPKACSRGGVGSKKQQRFAIRDARREQSELKRGVQWKDLVTKAQVQRGLVADQGAAPWPSRKGASVKAPIKATVGQSIVKGPKGLSQTLGVAEEKKERGAVTRRAAVVRGRVWAEVAKAAVVVKDQKQKEEEEADGQLQAAVARSEAALGGDNERRFSWGVEKSLTEAGGPDKDLPPLEDAKDATESNMRAQLVAGVGGGLEGALGAVELTFEEARKTVATMQELVAGGVASWASSQFNGSTGLLWRCRLTPAIKASPEDGPARARRRVVRDTLRVCFSRLPVGFRCARRRGSLGYGGVLGAGTRA